MKYTEKTLAKAHRAGQRHTVWLLYGAETYLVERWAKTLMGEEPDANPFNAQRLDGKAPDLEALWDAVQAMPFFAEEKRVLLDGLEASSFHAEDLKAFETLLEELPDTTTLIITAKDPGFGTSAGGKKIIKLAEKLGAAVELGTPSPGDMEQFLQQEAEHQGCTLDSATARYLLQICPSDMQILQNELDKICSYAKEGKITRKHIDAVAIPKIEARTFDLQKFILRGDAGGALRLLADLFSLREDPIAILAALSMGFCDLYRAKCVRNAGGSRETLITQFGYRSEYRARKAYEESARHSTSRLRKMVLMLCDCDRLIKSTAVDTRLRLEQLTVELSALCREGRS
jgi:DNA polymerase-3 subunit delta